MNSSQDKLRPTIVFGCGNRTEKTNPHVATVLYDTVVGTKQVHLSLLLFSPKRAVNHPVMLIKYCYLPTG